MNALATRLFSEYSSAHSTRGNRVCHLAGIPLITFSVVLALSRIPIAGSWSAAEVAIVVTTLAALFIDPPAAAVFFAFLAASDLVSRAIPAWISPASPARILALALGLFVLGWIFQLVGHAVYEKNRPAFLRNLRHLLIGPLWISKKIL